MEFIESFKEFIRPELFLLIPVLYFIGSGMKQSQYIADRKIPLFLGIIGILLCAIWVGATTPFTGYQDVLMGIFVAITQGILCAGCSVYVNQLIKQREKRDEDAKPGDEHSAKENSESQDLCKR